MQVGLITDNFNFLINNLDIESINLKPYSYGGANITVFRILDSENSEMKIFEDFLRKEMAAAVTEAADKQSPDEDENEENDEKSDDSSSQMQRISSFTVQDINSENCIEEGGSAFIRFGIKHQIKVIQLLAFLCRFHTKIEKSPKRIDL